jgi:undecaprenyl-diphosphatase
MDVAIFKAVNIGIGGPVSEWLWILITTPETWWGPVAALVGGLVYFDRLRGALAVVLTILVISAMDAATFHLIKPYFARIRPCNTIEGVRAIIGCTDSFSFPSNHSINSLALAGFLGGIYRSLLPMLLTLGVLVCVSRVAVGVHYPSDVMAGGALGFVCGFALAKLCETYILKKPAVV